MDALANRTADSVAAFIAPGQPFELIERVVGGASCRVFRHAPRTLSELYAAARLHADKVFLVSDGERCSYARLLARAATLAGVLSAQGVAAGEHVAIAMRNRPEWLIAFIATSALGAVPVLVNSRGSSEEIAHSLRHTRCRRVLADGERAARIAAAGLHELEGLVVGSAPAALSHWLDFAAASTAAGTSALPQVERAAEDAALIMFTSGTTGRPRATVLHHLGVLTALMANQLSTAVLGARLATQAGVDLATLARHAPQPCTLLVFPLFHTSGCLSVFLANLVRGGKLVLLPRWSAHEALRLVQEERITSIPAVPTMLWDLLNEPARAQFDTSSLVNLGTGGQGMPPNLLEAIRRAYPRAILGTGYGMTETNGMVSLLLGEEYLAHPESAGRPLPTAQIRIVDESGRAVPPGDCGEVCIRSAQNMRGYFADPAAEAERVRDGWLYSGDLGRLDAEGLLHIVGRRTDMVISGGENVYCAEVERVLLTHPEVLEATTVALPDERLGERLAAVVVKRAASALTAEELEEFCAGRLARYKVPRVWRFESDPLERNATGKVLKGRVRARLFGH
jgi:long-chain acyl-CoA synthetase